MEMKHKKFYEYICLLKELGADEEAARLQKLLKEKQDSKVNILFAGKFNAGKSTLINALVGEKRQRTGALPETAEVAEVICHRYKNVVLIDTPGHDTEYAVNLSALPCADILIYVLNAGNFMSSQDREMIQEIKKQWQGSTVFFVINWMDLIPTDPLKNVEQQMKQCIKAVWGEKSMIFFTNGFLAECIRTDSPYTLRQGHRFISMQISEADMEESGLPGLEDALLKAASSHKTNIQYCRRRFAIIKQTLHRTEEMIGQRQTAFETVVEELSREKENLAHISSCLQMVWVNIEQLFSQLLQEIATKTGQFYDNFVKDVEEHWDGHFDQAKVDFGIIEQAKLAKCQVEYEIKKFATHRLTEKDIQERNARFKESTYAVSLSIQEYIQNKSYDMKSQMETECESLLLAYEKRLSELGGKMMSAGLDGVDLQEILSNVMDANGIKADIIVFKEVKPEQLVLSLVLFQNTTMAYDSLFVQMSPEEFIAEGLYRKLYGLCVTTAIGCVTGTYFLGLLAQCAYQVFRRYEKASDMGRQLLLSAREETVRALRSNRQAFMGQMEHELEKNLADSRRIFQEIRERIMERNRADMEQVIQRLKQNEMEQEKQLQKDTSVLNRMRDICSEYESMLTKMEKGEEFYEK